jgi:hypothetical protein
MNRRDKRICTSCGATNLGSHTNCPICDAPLPPFPGTGGEGTVVSSSSTLPQRAPAPPPPAAPSSPAPIQDRVTPAPPAHPQQPESQAKPRSGRRRALFAIVGILMLLCLCSCACVYLTVSGTFGTELELLFNELIDPIRDLLP